ncbi:MAG: 3-oxoacyl-[acyl-carrier-protein] synthase [Abditibacteriota bacterium]|nr:3-oxoacyl-[acyl-carrier-protein] synthase [Abditibacteriota bacterium]
MQHERVVVTGYGAITPLGTGVPEFWQGVQEGRSGIDVLTIIDPTRHSTRFGGEVKNFDPETYIDRKEARRMDRVAQLAIVASDEALASSGLKIDHSNHDDVGVVIGCGIGGLATWEREHAKLLDKGPDRVSPFLIPMMIPNMASGHVSIRTGARGPNTATVSACTSSAHALGLAYDLIRRGDAQVMLTGGTEAPICDSAMAGFGNMRALSRHNEDPARASRPFDKTRDGFVIGEGAGTLVLESLTHAQKRGAHIYAEMLAYGMSSDAYHITDMPEDGRGLGTAMTQALLRAGLTPEDVQYINAHGTSTPTNDRTETAAIKAVFGEHAYKLAVSSTKSQIGHLLGAGSAVEFIATVLGLQNQLMPPTINYRYPDPDCDLDYVPNEARRAEMDIALCNSSGFGGHNVSIAVRRWSE